MRNYWANLVILGSLLIAGVVFGASLLSFFHQSEEEKFLLLEKVYLALKDFEQISDKKAVFLWQGDSFARFKKLAGIRFFQSFPIKVNIDVFQKPAETLSRKGGDCEDFALLFASAARVLGIPAKVVIGRVLSSKNFHAWVEVFYQGKWIIIDPWRAPEGIPFRFFFSSSFYSSATVLVKFDEKNISGQSPKRLVESAWRKERDKKEKQLFQTLITIFAYFQKREPNPEERAELKEISSFLFEEILQFVIAGLPEDPRVYIQFQEVQKWIQKL